MLRPVIFYIFLCTVPLSISAQESFPLLSSIDNSLSSIFNNPAGLSHLKSTAILIKHNNPFLLKELQSNRIGIVIPLKTSVFALSFEQFGTNNYILQQSRCALGKSFGNLSGGIGFTYRYEFINDGLASLHSLQIDLALQFHINEKIRAGFLIENPGKNTAINAQQRIEIGCQYQASKLSRVAIELEKENQKEALIKLGLQYQYYKNFELLFAIQNGLQPYQIANAFAFHRFQCQINTTYHSQLGFGFQYLLSYRL